MCISKNVFTFIYISCIAWVSTENCYPNYKLPKWEPFESENEAPANLRMGLVPQFPTAMEAQIENSRENFSLTLLANPFIKDKENCLPAASLSNSYVDLRKFHKSYSITKDGDENRSVYFGNVFTGCYYAEMTNAEGNKWLWDPLFVNTSHRYYDTMMKCEKTEIKSRDDERFRELKLELGIPLKCLKLRLKLFELSEIAQIIDNDHYRFGNVLKSRGCWVENKLGNGNLPNVSCIDTNFVLNTTPVVDKDEGWSIAITLNSANKDSGSYYVSIAQYYVEPCNTSSYRDLNTWQPVVKFDGFLWIR